MKPQKPKLIIIALIALLVWSVVLNVLQGEQVRQLMKEVDEMENTQAILSAKINDLEDMGAEEYGY